jgi:putative ABC transport system ATP-binding protein
MNPPILEARAVKKTFAEGRQTVRVLDGVSLGVQRGEVVGLEGPSGSGKTTLLSILGCILTPSGGEVWVDGQPVDGNQRQLASVRRKSIGFIFQQFNLFGALTALENVEYALNLKGRRGREARTEAADLLTQVDLAERKDFLPRDLSGGQKQRVAIARALAGDSPILLADEPTANIDSATATQILQLFRELAKQQNRALVIVTHDPKVRAITDRVLLMRDGQIMNLT